MDKIVNYYEILEVNEKASKEIISKVFKMHIKKNHPDLFQGEEKLQAEEKIKKLNEAYEILNDDYKREEYDKRIIEQKNAILYDLENQIIFLKEELFKKQELIKDIGIEMGIEIPENDTSQETYNDVHMLQDHENTNDNDSSHTNSVVKSYFNDIKAFLYKASIIIIGFIIFCLGTWRITGINIIKALIDGLIKRTN